MGHLSAKDIYRSLGEKIDGLSVRAPFNDTLHEILKELYTEEEADVVIKMPYGLTNAKKIAKHTGCDTSKTKNILDGLSLKGLVLDVEHNGEKFYMPSPMVIGIFEFTMMRSGSGLDHKKMAKLFHEYFKTFTKENAQYGGMYNVLRVIPYEDQIAPESYIEVMDYEKASKIVDQNDRFAIGICSCRHEKFHLGEKKCDTLLETCISIGVGADYLIKNNISRQASKAEIQELLLYAKEKGLVYSADNVQKGIQCMCLCCGCCCNYLSGINRFGIAHSVITSNYIAEVNDQACIGCGACAKACPVGAIEMVAANTSDTEKRKKKPVINKSICIGCGVCASKCKPKALLLENREQRRITPENTFHRLILQALERGTLQNLIFDNPQSKTHNFFRGLLGGFLQLDPVKRSLMSDTLRSNFLKNMELGMKLQGKGWITDL